MKNTYCIKHFHSADKNGETIVEPDIDYSYWMTYKKELLRMWNEMGLKTKSGKNRIEAIGNTYSMAAYVEKNNYEWLKGK